MATRYGLRCLNRKTVKGQDEAAGAFVQSAAAEHRDWLRARCLSNRGEVEVIPRTTSGGVYSDGDAPRWRSSISWWRWARVRRRRWVRSST